MATTEAQLVKPDVKMTTLRTFFEANKGKLATILPKHFSLDRQGQLLFTAIQRNPQLLDCTPASLMGALVQGGMFGLEPVGPGGYWLVPFWQSGKDGKPGHRNVTMIIDYRGLMGMARRSRQVKVVDWRAVYAGDKFEYQYGSEGFIRHVPSPDPVHSIVTDDKGRKTEVSRTITHCYAYGLLDSGATVFEVMTIDDIRWHRDRYSRAAKAGPWITNEDEMGAKTCVRKLADKLPFDPLLSQAVLIDNKAEQGVDQDLSALFGGDVEEGNGAGGDRLSRAVDGLKAQDAAREAAKTQETTNASTEGGAAEARDDAPPADGGETGERAEPGDSKPAAGNVGTPAQGPGQPVQQVAGGGVPSPAASKLIDAINSQYDRLELSGPDPVKKRQRTWLWDKHVGPKVDEVSAAPEKLQKLVDELTKLPTPKKK